MYDMQEGFDVPAWAMLARHAEIGDGFPVRPKFVYITGGLRPLYIHKIGWQNEKQGFLPFVSNPTTIFYHNDKNIGNQRI